MVRTEVMPGKLLRLFFDFLPERKKGDASFFFEGFSFEGFSFSVCFHSSSMRRKSGAYAVSQFKISEKVNRLSRSAL